MAELFWDKIMRGMGLESLGQQPETGNELRGLLAEQRAMPSSGLLSEPRLEGPFFGMSRQSQMEQAQYRAENPIDYDVVRQHVGRNIPAGLASIPGFAADILAAPSTITQNIRYMGRPEEQAPFFPRGERMYEGTQQFMYGLLGEPDPIPNPRTAATILGGEILLDPLAAAGLFAKGPRIARGAQELSETIGRNIQDYQPKTPGSPMTQIGAVGDLTPQQPDVIGLLGQRNEMGLYSGLERGVANLQQQRGTGEQMLAMIQRQKDVKPEEIAWTGLDEFLKGKSSVTKNEIADYLLNNRVELREVALRDPNLEFPYVGNEWQQAINRAELEGDWDLAERINAAWETYEGFGPTEAPKFSQYTTPGGSNYRELLMTMPNVKAERLNARRREIESFGAAATDAQKQEWADIMNQLQPETRDIEGVSAFRGMPDYRSSHYDQPNILAHTRVKDYNQDGQKILHVDEVQSDWHQAGRKKGYRSPETLEQWYNRNKIEGDPAFGDLSSEQKRIIRENRDAGMGSADAVPDAPFKKNWHELMTRRILQEAAEKGYDRVTFTTGKTQADRYDLRKSIEEIHYSGSNLTAYDKQGNAVIQQTGIREADLPDLIGKEAAEKLLNQPKQGTLRSLVGQELEVGGEGMKGFYDNMMVKAFNKEGKKYGVKVEPYSLKAGKDGEQVWSIMIPDEMRAKKKTEGSPMFSVAPAIPAAGLLAEPEQTPQNTPTRGIMDF